MDVATFDNVVTADGITGSVDFTWLNVDNWVGIIVVGGNVIANVVDSVVIGGSGGVAAADVTNLLLSGTFGGHLKKR